ncbi:hypothetical protein AB0C18_43185 [Nonomuraea muscovyensis]
MTLALGSLVYAINRAGSHGAGDALTLYMRGTCGRRQRGSVA